MLGKQAAMEGGDCILRWLPYFTLVVMMLVVVAVRPAVAGPIVIVSQHRGVWASTKMYRCPRWPPGAVCHTIEKSSSMIARSRQDSLFRAFAWAGCPIASDADLQQSGTGEQNSTLDSSRFKAFGFAQGSAVPAHAMALFHVTFLVPTACEFRFLGTLLVEDYGSKDAIRAKTSLIGENTHIELLPECCGVEQSKNEIGTLARGHYEFLSFVATGPDPARGSFSLDLQFPTETSVQEATWGSVRNLYR